MMWIDEQFAEVKAELLHLDDVKWLCGRCEQPATTFFSHIAGYPDRPEIGHFEMFSVAVPCCATKLCRSLIEADLKESREILYNKGKGPTPQQRDIEKYFPFSPPKPTLTCSNPNCVASSVNQANMSICSRCKVAPYCSAACQRAHWAVHKEICRASRTKDDE